MDRQILRKKARAEFKKMMKGRPKHQRLAFAEAFPIIKSMLEHGMTNEQLSSETKAEVVAADDAALIEGMMEQVEPAQTKQPGVVSGRLTPIDLPQEELKSSSEAPNEPAQV